MPDDTIRLRTELSGAAELSHLWKLFSEGNAKIGEMYRLKKILNESFKQKIPGSENIKEIGERMLQVNTAINAVVAQTRPMTAFGNTMRDLTSRVRELRTEQRLQSFILSQLTHALGTTAQSIAEVATKSDTAKKQIKAYSDALGDSIAAGSGMAVTLRLIGGSAAALAGPVGWITGLFSIFANVMRIGREEMEKFVNEGIKKFTEQIPKMSLEDIDKKLLSLENRLKELRGLGAEFVQPFYAFGELIKPESLKNIDRQIALLEAERKVLGQRKMELLDNAQAAFEYLKSESQRVDLAMKDKETMVAAIKTMKNAREQTALMAGMDKWLADEKKKEIDAAKKQREERDKASKEARKHVLDLKKAELDLQAATVETMKEGTAKRIATLQLEYDKRINTYRQMRKDLPELAKETHERELAEYRDFLETMGALLRLQAAEAAQAAYLTTPEGQEQLRRQGTIGMPSAGAGMGGRLARLHKKPATPFTTYFREKQAEKIQEFLERPQTQILSRAFEVVGQSIEDNIISKLNLANNLIGNLARTLISTAAQTLIQAATFAAMGSLGGAGSFGDIFKSFFGGKESHQYGGSLFENVVGIGARTGRIHTFEQGERITPVMPSYRQMEPIPIRIEGRFVNRGRDQIASFVTNRILFRKKSLSRSGL